MKRILVLVFLVTVGVTSPVTAQEAAIAESLQTLRAQLNEVQAKESDLQARLRQLDEELKPENIERSLAGIGSTHPEQLREQRSRELTIQRDGVQAQLKLVTTSRERLESVIRTAEAQAYQRSAEGNASLLNGGQSTRMIAILAVASVLLAAIIALALIKRTRTT